MIDLVRFTLSTQHWGEVLLARPLPLGDEYWGHLAPLRDTVWGDLLPVVSGLVLSHAAHGHADPLIRVIGPPPDALLKMVPDPYRKCAEHKDCIMFVEKDCHPCKKMPDCYVPPNLPSKEAQAAAALVALAWRDDRYVVISKGAEFSL